MLAFHASIAPTEKYVMATQKIAIKKEIILLIIYLLLPEPDPERSYLHNRPHRPIISLKRAA